MECLRIAIKRTRDTALKLQDDMPFSLHLTPVEKAAQELVSNLLAAATEAENQLKQ